MKYDKYLRNKKRLEQGEDKIESVIYYERLLIRDRWNKIKQRKGWKRGNIYLKEWVQSSVWYNLNKYYLIPLGIPTTESTRDYATANISKICAELEEDWIVTQEEVGITASTRAFLYFNGSWLAVDISKIEELAGKGTDQVFIEKRGGIDQVTNFVGDYGIAFCNTQGHFVVYAEGLIKAAKDSDGHIETITDFDCAGLNIAERVMVREDETEGYDEEEDNDELQPQQTEDDEEDDNFIERLGIDPIDTLMYFGLQRNDVEQIYPLKLEKNKTTGEFQLKKDKDKLFEVTNPIAEVVANHPDMISEIKEIEGDSEEDEEDPQN